MFDFGFMEIVLIAAVALVVLGPKELPRIIRTVSEWLGRARGLAREFRSGLDDIARETEINKVKEDFEKTAREAEAEMRNVSQSIEADTKLTPEEMLGTSGYTGSPASSYPDYYTSADWSTGAKLLPLRDDQRRKKPLPAKPRPVFKQRHFGRPQPLAPGIRRKARP
jgi:sec-independent protein translocase protein TatB